MIPDIPGSSRMETTSAIASVDAIRLSDWIEDSGLSRSTAYELLKLLGIEPEARKVPASRKPVSHLTTEQLELIAPWASELRRGATLPQIRERLGQIQTVQDAPPEASGMVPADPGQSQIIPANQLINALAAAVSHQQQADPLQRARGLREAADDGLVLTSSDLGALLGQGVSGWSDGEERYGYRFHRHKQGSKVLWTVERAIATAGRPPL